MTFTPTRPNVANREMANAIELLVKRELSDQYGLYLTSGDELDLTDDNQIVLINSGGDIGYLPYPTTGRHAALVAAMIHLRDTDTY